MTFPTTALPVAVEIAPGADPTASPGTWTWSDITDQVRLADRISIVTGRQNEASQVDPSRCTLTLDNTSGDFTPRNPAGQWYGQLARNTPLRVSISPAEDTFSRTSSNGWGSADSGQAWSMYGGGGSVLTSDFTVSGGKGSQSVPAAAGYRSAFLPDLSVLDCRVLLSGVSLPFTNVTGASVEPGNIMLRAQSSTEYYLARVEITTAEAVVCKLYDPDGSVLASATVSGLTHSSSQTLEVLAEIVGNTLSMKVWASSSSEPSGWHVTATDDSITAPGWVGVRTGVASGNTNTLPVVASYDSVTVWVDRFCGFVSSWPPRWDKSGNNATVPIQADGVLRRLGKGTPPVRSALRRTLGASDPVAYWPAEDGAAASRVGSAIAGHAPLRIDGTATFADIQTWIEGQGYEVNYGSSALVDLADGAIMSALLPSTATAATGEDIGWTAALAADVPPAANVSGDLALIEVRTPLGTYGAWRMVITTGGHTQVQALSGSTWTTVVDDSSVFTSMSPHNFAVWQSSAGVITAGYGWSSVTGWEATGTIAGTVSGATTVVVNATGVTSTVPVPAGHIAVWAGHGLDVVDKADGPMILALYGYEWSGLSGSGQFTGEAATVRLARLAAEDGVTLTMPSVDTVDEVMMGLQKPGTPLDLYRQCETADQGVLYESGFGLAYLPRANRYNRTVTLTVDFDAGQVAEPPQPSDDDQNLLNRVTARRTDGSSAVAEDADSIAANGPYDGAVDLNLSSDSRLPDYASWIVHVGATDVMRWPVITVNLARSPELVDAVLSCRVQSRMVATNPPAQAAGDDIDVLIEGYAETLGTYEWVVSFNGSPARPWDVGEADGDAPAGCDGGTLASSVTAAGTSLSLATTAANGLWTTAAGAFPLDLRVGGERVTVSAISGSSSPQTATVSARAVNGVSAAWAAGTEVDVWLPATAAL